MSRLKAPPRYGGVSTKQSGHPDKKLMRYLTCAMFHEILFRTNTYPMSVPKCRANNHHRYWKSMSFLGVPFHMYLGQKTLKMVNKVVRRGIDDLFLLDQVQFKLHIYNNEKKETACFITHMNWESDAIALGTSRSASRSSPVKEPIVKILFRRLVSCLTSRWDGIPDASNEWRTIKIDVDDFDYDFETSNDENEEREDFGGKLEYSRQKLTMVKDDNSSSSSSSISSTSRNGSNFLRKLVPPAP